MLLSHSILLFGRCLTKKRSCALRRMVYMEADTSTRAHTPAMVAGAINKSPATVYTLIRSGRLRAVKVGRTYVVPEESLAAFLAGES